MNKKYAFILILLLLLTGCSTKTENTLKIQSNDSKVMESPTKEDKQESKLNSHNLTKNEVQNEVQNEVSNEVLNNTKQNQQVINKSIKMPEPPYVFYKSDKVLEQGVSPILLKLKSQKANEIIDDDKWFNKNNLSLNCFQVPGPSSNINEELPKEIKDYWNSLKITKAFYDDSYIYCAYGENYDGYVLNIFDKSFNLIYSLDFSTYKYSPDYIEKDYDYILQRINWASIKNNVLYISHSHNTYASSSKNMNAYITAIDLSDMSILWRSKALISNSENFLITDNIIICGYGFTNEPDYLYELNIYSGEVIEKIPIKTAASYIIRKDDTIYVRTYNTDYEFNIK